MAKTPTSAEKLCLQSALPAFRNLTAEDLEGYVKDVLMRAHEFEGMSMQSAIDRAKQEINDQYKNSYFSTAQQKAKNLTALKLNAEPIKSGKATARGIYVGRGYKKRNLPGSIKAEYGKMIDFIVGDLSHEEFEEVSSGKHDNDILAAHAGRKVDNPLAKKMADKIDDWFTYREAQLVLSGAMKFEEIHGDRNFRGIHDAGRIMSGNRSFIDWAKSLPGYLMMPKEERIKARMALDNANKESWINKILGYVNKEKTFLHTSAVNIDPATGLVAVNESKARNITKGIFNNITTGKSQIFTKSVVRNDQEAVENKRRMFFVFKDLESQYKYNQEYGNSANLFGMIIQDALSTARQVGVAKIMGDNPYAMYNDIRHVQEESAPQGGLWWHNTDNMFKSVMQTDRASVSPSASNMLANLRTYTSMIRLPLIALQSISDIGFVASWGQRISGTYFDKWGYHFTNLFNAIPNDRRDRVAKKFLSLSKSELGSISRWVEQGGASGLLQKASSKFFKAAQLEAFDKGLRDGQMEVFADQAGEESVNTWDNMNPYTRKYLDQFIEPNEWEVLRKHTQDGLFSTDNVDSLSDEEVHQLWEENGKAMPLSDVRDDLYRRTHNMFSVAVENAVLAPGDWERGMIYQGTNPGSALGMMVRTMTQFKMFAVAFTDRVLLQGWHNADTAQQKIIWASSLLMGTLPLSYATMYFKNMLMGVTMPDPSLMSIPQREQYYMELLAPSLSISFGLLDAKNQNSGLLLSLLGNPVTSLLGNAISVPLSLAEGDPERASKRLKSAFSYIVPTRTFPIIPPLINQAMGDETYLEPGQTTRYGQ